MEVPYNIANHRRELCERCPTPCQYQNDPAFRAEGDNACPERRWMAYQLFVKVKKMKGAGDAVAAVAEPIAAMMDKMFKTKIKGCSACAKRREMLNQYIPFGQRSEEYYKNGGS